MSYRLSRSTNHGAFWTSWTYCGSWVASSVPCSTMIGATMKPNPTKTPTTARNTTAIAPPRRSPRRISHSTTGSSPSARNSATTSSVMTCGDPAERLDQADAPPARRWRRRSRRRRGAPGRSRGRAGRTGRWWPPRSWAAGRRWRCAVRRLLGRDGGGDRAAGGGVVVARPAARSASIWSRVGKPVWLRPSSRRWASAARTSRRPSAEPSTERSRRTTPGRAGKRGPAVLRRRRPRGRGRRAPRRSPCRWTHRSRQPSRHVLPHARARRGEPSRAGRRRPS